jgi:class 3 adenylate cyclase
MEADGVTTEAGEEAAEARLAAEAPTELRTRMVSVSPLLQAFFQEPAAAGWLRRFAAECGVSELMLLDPHAWIPESFYYGILARIQDTVPNAVEAVRAAARQGFTQQTLGTFHTVIRAFSTPRMAYQAYSQYLNRIQAIGRYEGLRIGQCSAAIRYESRRETAFAALDCAYRMGALEAVPTVFGLPPARVESLACICQGDAECVYEIAWDTPRKLDWWYALVAMVAMGSAGVALLSLAGVFGTAAGHYAGGGLLLATGGWFWGVRNKWHRRWEQAEHLVVEQRLSIQKELANLWEKHEEILRQVRNEERIRKIFQKYVPGAVVERVLKYAGRVRSQGTQVHATILFADLVGFTSFAESVAPTEVLTTINTYLGRFSEVVFAHGGVVDKFMGDAVMALFGVLEAAPCHTQYAVKAALDMLDAVEEINQRSGQQFQLRIGIHTGLVVAGHVGSRERVAFTVMGDAVNLASRLQSEALAGTILVSEAVREASAECGTFTFQGAHVVKGRTQATPMYRVVRK